MIEDEKFTRLMKILFAISLVAFYLLGVFIVGATYYNSQQQDVYTSVVIGMIWPFWIPFAVAGFIHSIPR